MKNNLNCQRQSSYYYCPRSIQIPKWRILLDKYFTIRLKHGLFPNFVGKYLTYNGWKVCGYKNKRLGLYCEYCKKDFEYFCCDNPEHEKNIKKFTDKI